MKKLDNVIKDLFCTLEFREEKSWGNQRLYPINEGAIAILRLVNTKTLRPQDITLIKEFGSSIGIDIKIVIKQELKEL